MPIARRVPYIFLVEISDIHLGVRQGDRVVVDPVTFEATVVRPLRQNTGALLGALDAGWLSPVSHRHDDARVLLRAAAAANRPPVPPGRRPARVLPLELPARHTMPGAQLPSLDRAAEE